ncbi:DNA recombination protein RmuC [Stutzerimonas tarimensis]|uniref:DNA recombination protein RmuC n=1 Tax=Stutzerimonas tarimensis TaxID=1507735 RepID=A0ABV7TA89_9GAMM
MTDLDMSWALVGGGMLLVVLLAFGLLLQALRLRDNHRLLDAARQQIEQFQSQAREQAEESRELHAALRAEKAHVEQLQRQLDYTQEELLQQRELAQHNQQHLMDSRGTAEAAKARSLQMERQQAELRENFDKLQASHEELLRSYATLGREHATLRSTLEQREQHFGEQQQLLKESREQLKLEFQQLAGQIFEAKGLAFSQHSQQSLDALLKPFREQIEGFRHRVEDIHHRDVQQQSALLQELSHLKALNLQITQEAHELATALKGQKKTQGNWGELILENVLERSGLVRGRDFQREVSFNAEEGRRRPDAIVYLPQGKHLIIDAKVSLNAYTRYINAEDEGERRVALNEHVTAVSQRIRELADRNYWELPGLNAPEMVFMFVPIESAFVEALKADESLFQKAIEQNVLVATPTTLLTSLNIVRQLWRFEDQNKHSAELAERASKVYDKLRTFLGSMDGVGKSLDRAQEAYKRACDQLMHGKGNLVKQVNDFRQLGVAVKSEIGEEWAERADLELGLVAPLDAEQG